MNKGDKIVIERVENGWLVRPEREPQGFMVISELLVFNQMGYASSAGDGNPYLLGFIEDHFQPNPKAE